MQFLAISIFVGVGATVFMDIWAILMSRLFHIPSLDYKFVGRWVGCIPSGVFIHDQIAKSSPVRGELVLGWGTHYAVGVIFASVFMSFQGPISVVKPDFLGSLLFGVATLVAPFFVMQPGMGAGIAGSKTPSPNVTRLRSLMAHSSYGVGLYLSIIAFKLLFGSV